jgi:hypothetical protein
VKIFILIFTLITQLSFAQTIENSDSNFKRHSISFGHVGFNFLDGRGFIMFNKPDNSHLYFIRIAIPNLFSYNFDYAYNFKKSKLSVGINFMPFWYKEYLTPDEKREIEPNFQPIFRYFNQFGVFAKYKFINIKNLKLAPVLGVNYRFGETRYYVHKFRSHTYSDGQFYHSLGPNIGFSAEFSLYKTVYLKADMLYQYYFEKYNPCECYPVEYSNKFKREIPNRQFLQANLSLGIHFNIKANR